MNKTAIKWTEKPIKRIKLIVHVLISAIALVMIILNVPFIEIDHQGSILLPVVTTVEYFTSNALGFYLTLLLGMCFVYLEFRGDTSASHVKQNLFSLVRFIVSFLSIISMIHNPLLHVIAPEVNNPAFEFEYDIGSIILMIILFTICIESLITIIHKIMSGFKIKVRKLASFLLSTILATFFSTLIHESGHALLVLMAGGTITNFQAYPWRGFVSWTGVPTTWLPIVQIGGFIAQHCYLAIFIILIKLDDKNHLKIKSDFIRTILIVTAILAWLDFPTYALNTFAGIPHWFFIGSPEGDVIDFVNQTSIRTEIVSTIAIFEIIIGLILIYRQNSKIIRIFFEESTQKSSEKSFLISP